MTAAVEVEVVVEEEVAVMCQLAAEASWEVDDGRKSAVDVMDASELYVNMAYEDVEVMVVTAAVEVVVEEVAVVCQLAAAASWEVDDGR